MVDLDAIIEVKRALGRQLAAYREAAGLNQHQLARRVSYGRSTVANVETGRQSCSRAFWERCDAELDTDGALIRGYQELNALTRARRADIAHLMDAERIAKLRRL